VKYIKDSGLVVWCWGAEANDAANVRRLKQLGVQAVINDKVVQHSAKNESVFLIEAREAAKLLTRLK
jgi:Glycerophosphoryl diester phosphodiesterase family.